MIGVACAVASVISFFAASKHFKHVAETDERIVADVRTLLESHFSKLSEPDEIYARYGKFQKLDDGKWNRPQYAFQLVERIDFSTTARFEKAQIRVGLGISQGDEARIIRMELSPNSSWVPQKNAELKLMDHEFWVVGGDGRRKPSEISGWAVHPDFIYE